MDPFIGEIRAFAFGVVPRGWHLCDGATLPIQQNAALYSLLGVVYGGDGRTTFKLPDMRGRVSLCQGLAPDGVQFPIGNADGLEGVVLSAAQVPAHTHNLNCSSAVATTNNPAGAVPAVTATDTSVYADAASPASTVAAGVIALAGQSLAHDNMQPSVAVSFCIATQGLYPPRS